MSADAPFRSSPGAASPEPVASTGRVRLVHVLTVPESFLFLRGQLGYMHERGFELWGISSSGPYQGTIAALEPITLATVEMPRRITPLADLRAVRALVAAIRRVRPTIVHAHTPKGGLLGMLAARAVGVPVRVYHMRGLPMLTARGVRRALLRWSERIACACAHRVICVSHSVRAVAVAERLVAADRIVTLCGGSGNGVDAYGRFAPRPADRTLRAERRAQWSLPPDAVVVAFVGRVVRDKGVVELAQAWTALRERHPDAHLVIAGAVEPQDPVPEAVLAGLRGDARVHFLGHADEVRDVYAAADLIVLPTHREGFPNVPLEAAAMQLPVVSTRIPGCVDAVADGRTGLLVPPGDAEALAGALGVYLSDPARRARDGAAGRARVLAEFDRTRIWEALHAEYRALLARRAPAALRSLGAEPTGDGVRRPRASTGAAAAARGTR